MTDSRKALIFILGGVALGIIAGILVAPNKGSGTRKRIVDSSRKIAENAKDFATSAASTVSGLKEKFFRKDGHTLSEIENHSW